jgi:phage gp29-like protein
MQFINYYDTMIFRAFLIGSLLLGQSEAKGGSYAQSQTHADTLNIFLDGVHMDLTSSIQEMIRTLVDLNFITDRYPKFEFELFTKKDLLGLLSALQPLADKFMIDPSSEWFHQLLKRIMEEYADIEVSDEIMPGNQAFPTEEEEEFIEEEGEELAERNEEMLIGIGEIMNPTTPE